MKKSHLLALATAMVVSSAAHANYHSMNVYEVTVTNITKSINFTPVMVAAHKRNVNFFDVGESASAALERVAEGGDTSQIAALFTGSADEVLTAAGPNIPLLQAGESSTVTFESRLRAPKFSIASMLLPTNDAFAARESIKLPRGKKQKTVYIRAYDAGTEENDESCANIPGPTCGGTPFSDEASSDEGFVYVHNGIHGIADLEASKYTWNNPVMKVTIRRRTSQ
jgi:hypothetical protein